MPEPARPCGGVAPPAPAPEGGRSGRAWRCTRSHLPCWREGGWGAPGDAQGAARCAGGSEAVGRSRSDPRPSCGSRPGRPQRAGGKEVAEWRTSEGGEDRGEVEHAGGRDGGRGRRGQGGGVHAGGREATRGQRRWEDSRRKTRERKKDRNGTCVTSGRWVIFVIKSG